MLKESRGGGVCCYRGGMGALSGMGTAWTLILTPAVSCIEQLVDKEAQEQSSAQGPAPSISRLSPSLPWERWWWDQSGLGWGRSVASKHAV